MHILTTKINIDQEQRILSKLIHDPRFHTEVLPALEPQYFTTPESRLIYEWIAEYSARHNKAPDKDTAFFFAKNSEGIKKEALPILEAHVERLVKEPEAEITYSLELDSTTDWIAQRKLECLIDDLKRYLAQGDLDKAQAEISDYKRPNIGRTASIDVFQDLNNAYEAFNASTDALFRFPEALGEVVGDIARGDFVAFVGPPKRGKTWWLMHSAYTASIFLRRTLYINLEMTQQQCTRRFWQPVFKGTGAYGDYRVPKFVRNEDRTFSIEYETKKPARIDLSDPKAFDAVKTILPNVPKTQSDKYLKMITRPTGTFTLDDLRAELHSLRYYEDFTPDVIVIDYADIMAGTGREERHRLNAIWAGLRGFAQEYDCAIITASQSGRQTMDGAKDVHGSDIVEDMRKLAHVTMAIAINQNEKEREMGLTRLKPIIRREGDDHREVVVLQTLKEGRIHAASRPMDMVRYEDALDVVQ